MTPQTITFATSPFWPVAIGFFGLGTGYFIWGGQALFGYPKASPEVDRTMGMWGFWMPGFCQFYHRRVPHGGIDMVRRFRKCRASVYGGLGVHGVRNPLVCDGPSPLYRVERNTRRMDGHRILLRFRARNLCVW